MGEDAADGAGARYIWLYGVLGWGLTMGVLWPLAMAAVQGWERLPLLMAIGVPGFAVGGYFFGTMTWRLAEQQYADATRDDS